MRRYFMHFLILFLMIGPRSLAQSKGGHLFTELSAGYINRPFVGVLGTSFSEINHGALDISFKYIQNNKVYNIGCLYTPQINLSEAHWSDGTKGAYTLEFLSPYIGYGTEWNKYVFEFQTGFESLRWSGTPDMGYSDSVSTIYAIKISKIIEMHKKPKLSFPFSIRFWARPERDLQFNLKSSENSKINSGNGLDILAGVAYEVF